MGTLTYVIIYIFIFYIYNGYTFLDKLINYFSVNTKNELIIKLYGNVREISYNRLTFFVFAFFRSCTTKWRQ